MDDFPFEWKKLKPEENYPLFINSQGKLFSVNGINSSYRYITLYKGYALFKGSSPPNESYNATDIEYCYEKIRAYELDNDELYNLIKCIK